jgi:hypothetical protein
MTDTCLAEDIAKLLLAPNWKKRSNLERLTALNIAYGAVKLAHETGVRRATDIVKVRRGSHDDAA